MLASDGDRPAHALTDTVTAREGEAPHAPAERVQTHEVGLSVHDLPTVPATSELPDAPPVASAMPETTPPTSSHGHRTTASAAAPVDSLGEEAARLRLVREDISAGRALQALRKLDQYDERFGRSGAMREEAAVTRVEALLQAGRTSEAHALGSRLLDERPNGAFARKLRSLLASSGAPSSESERASQH